ncbi:acid-sensing ion channel 4-B-like [Tachypleus tridentatus]|uniref:acid-sensing ion channel 4-B-like n=1 Tax=Tachypleus tridentatus TaxID=6853 RepID=UPI003FD15B25
MLHQNRPFSPERIFTARSSTNISVKTTAMQNKVGVSVLGEMSSKISTCEHPETSVSKKDTTYLRDLFRHSSVNALNQIFSSRNFIRQLVWALILFGGLIGCIYNSINFLSEYFQYPIVINVYEGPERPLPFPGVTLCNLNRWKASRICNYGINPCSTYFSSVTKGFKVPIRLEAAVCNPKDPLSKEQTDKLGIMSFYSQLNDSYRRYVGHQAEDFFKKCTFRGYKCSSSNFSQFTNFMYGNCFSFNVLPFFEEEKELLVASSTGRLSGLRLELNIEIEEYSGDSILPVGVRLAIHDPHVLPDPTYYGIDIPPFEETTVAVKQISRKRLKAPYQDKCKENIISPGEKGYTQEMCMTNCVQEENMRRCNCIDPTLDPFIKDAVLCDFMNRIQVCCLDEVHNDLRAKADLCHCPLPCQSTTYDLMVSSTILASRNSNNVYSAPYQGNLLRLEIYFETLHQIVYQQVPKYEIAELYSQLGGQLSLWLGISLVSFFESVELLVMVFKFYWQRCISSISK